MAVFTMSNIKPQKYRPLDSVRCISKVKPLNHPRIFPGIKADSEKLQEGIHGSAMSVPQHSGPVKDSLRLSICDRNKPDDNIIQPAKVSSGNTISHDNCKKKITEGLGREKNLKDQIEFLSKHLEELKVTLCRREEENKVLGDQLKTQETQYKAQLIEERSGHEMTKVMLNETREKIVVAHKRMERLFDEHRVEIERQKEESEKHITVKMAEKDSVIADLNQKISRLKLQMADTLKGNSWERQQQLEELTKELSRVHEECDMLHMRIKSISKIKQGQCSNCEENTVNLLSMQEEIKDKDAKIRILESLCSKFESQLTRQDKLLEQWALSKGHRISAPK